MKVYEPGPTLTIDQTELKDLDGTVASLKQVHSEPNPVSKPALTFPHSYSLTDCHPSVQLIVRAASAHAVLSDYSDHFFVGCRNIPGSVGENICKLLLDDRSLVDADCRSFFVLPGSCTSHCDIQIYQPAQSSVW